MRHVSVVYTVWHWTGQALGYVLYCMWDILGLLTNIQMPSNSLLLALDPRRPYPRQSVKSVEISLCCVPPFLMLICYASGV